MSVFYISRFFEAHPEYQEMFAHFAQVPQRALPESAAFLAQAGVMLTTFDVMIDSLVSQERLMQELERIGANHYQRGVSSDMIGVGYMRPLSIMFVEHQTLL